MLLDGEEERSSAIWTKDYVEHLRTVHFSLITVSFGLIIFALSYHPEKIHTAANQIDDIINFKSVPSGDFLTKVTLDPPRTPSSDLAHQRLFVIPSPAKQIKFEFPAGSVVALENMASLYPQAKLDTLAEFGAMWNASQSPKHVLVVGKAYSFHLYYPSSQTETPLSPLSTDNSSILPLQRFQWSAEKVGNDFVLSTDLPVDGVRTQLRVQCKGEERIINIQKYLARQFSVPEGTFETAFPELNEMVPKNDLTRTLDKIKEQLHTEESAKAEDFVAFGLHIPPTVATRFGVLVVLALQWYFFLHLSELDRQFSANATGWTVPWIGIYEKNASKATFVLSAVVLPSIGVIILVVRGIQVGDTFLLWLLLPLATLSLIVGFLAVASMPGKAAPRQTNFE